MAALYSKIENVLESELELAEKEHLLFHSLHEVYCVLDEKIAEAI